jgi:hypothetical protein
MRVGVYLHNDGLYLNGLKVSALRELHWLDYL